VVVPGETPLTDPEPERVVATDVLLLLHVPKPGSVSEIELPLQTVDGPDTEEGSGLTVTTAVTAQLSALVYEIVVVPGRIPPTLPEVAPTVAVVDVLLLHVPPVVTSARSVADPIHVCNVPVIEEGIGLTVTTIVVLQPATIYVIVDVPAMTPDISPDPAVVAMDVAPLDQMPPVVRSDSVTTEPAHTTPLPDIEEGTGFTDTVIDRAQPEPNA